MRKIFVLPVALTCLLLAANSVWAQTATLTATVRPNPLEVEISYPGTVTVGQWFDISVTISNRGQETVNKTVATIHTPTEVSVKGQKKKLGDLTGGLTKPVTWRAKANTSGEFVVTVEVAGNLAGEEIIASDSTIIIATGTLGARLLRLIFGA